MVYHELCLISKVGLTLAQIKIGPIYYITPQNLTTQGGQIRPLNDAKPTTRDKELYKTPRNKLSINQPSAFCA